MFGKKTQPSESTPLSGVQSGSTDSVAVPDYVEDENSRIGSEIRKVSDDFSIQFNESSDDEFNEKKITGKEIVDFTWTKMPMTEVNFQQRLFTENFGPKVLVDKKSPLSVLTFSSENFLSKIVNEFNLYANSEST
ncbi:hypothetical protein HHI36_014194 [Cryptolaemus montrouzieri]|uniref:Uncharacterized protein n=1 Tax=Cryptolaemus montrouzieri TaxID=559131 RepID=A0ABD2N2H1_9CUCU